MKKSGIILILALMIGLTCHGRNVRSNAGADNELSMQDTVFNMRVGNRNLNILENLEGNKKVEFPKTQENEEAETLNESETDTLVYSESEGNDTLTESKSETERSEQIENIRQSERNDQFERNNRNNHWSWNRDNEDDFDRPHKRRNRFHGHWSAIEAGLNNYATSTTSMVLPDDISYMNLHSGKSMNFNLNFSQLNIGLCRWMGFVTGLGIDWNNYRFDGNNNIIKDVDGQIVMLDPNGVLKKSKFSTIYATLPVLFEVQVPVSSNTLRVSGGLIGAIKLASHTKMVYDNDEKVKSSGDLNLNLLRWGYTARAGYGNFQVYGTYYNTPMFQKGKGPGGVDLFPFEIGIAITFQD